jgi:hypothetical protein
MDYKGFLQKLSDLDTQISDLNKQKFNLIQSFKEQINEPYKHLLNQKVVVTYLTFDKKEKKEMAYFGGYRMATEIFVPVFYKIKANGDMSSQRHRFEWEEIISIEGLETEEPLKVGDKLTIKKIDKRLKNPDLRIWEIVEIHYDEMRNENRYDLVDVENNENRRYDYSESALLEKYKKIEE